MHLSRSSLFMFTETPDEPPALFAFVPNERSAPGNIVKYFLSFAFAVFSLSHPARRSFGSWSVNVTVPVFVSADEEMNDVPPTATVVYFTPSSSLSAIASNSRIMSSVISSRVPCGSLKSTVTEFAADSGMKMKPTTGTEKIERKKSAMIARIDISL